MIDQARAQELREQKVNAVDAEVIDGVPADVTPKTHSLNESIEQINKAFEGIQSNSKTFSLLVENDLKTIGSNIQLLIDAINTLAAEVGTLKNQKPE